MRGRSENVHPCDMCFAGTIEGVAGKGMLIFQRQGAAGGGGSRDEDAFARGGGSMHSAPAA